MNNANLSTPEQAQAGVMTADDDDQTQQTSGVGKAVGGVLKTAGKVAPIALCFTPVGAAMGATGLAAAGIDMAAGGLAGHVLKEAGKGVSGEVDGPTSALVNGASKVTSNVVKGAGKTGVDLVKAGAKHPLLGAGAIALARTNPLVAGGIGAALVGKNTISAAFQKDTSKQAFSTQRQSEDEQQLEL